MGARVAGITDQVGRANGHSFTVPSRPLAFALEVLKCFCLCPTELLLSGKLSEYGVFVPFSADHEGRFLSHVVSGPAASGSSASGRPPLPPSPPSSRHRVARSPSVPAGEPAGKYSIYFNVTIFGKEFHLGLKPNRRLVVPGAFTQWQEDFGEFSREPLRQECVFTGSITGMPGTAVAISNCDGLVRTGLPALRLCLLAAPARHGLRPASLVSWFGIPVGCVLRSGPKPGTGAASRSTLALHWSPA